MNKPMNGGGSDRCIVDGESGDGNGGSELNCCNGKETQQEENLRTIVNAELTRIGMSGPWVWKLFLLCMTPNILNGFHVSSYVFIGQMPEDFWCNVPEIASISTNWTKMDIRNISSVGSDGCYIKNWNYTHLAELSFSEAQQYTITQPQPDIISCRKKHGSNYMYKQDDGVSIVPEWDLICENSFWRTTVQVAVSIGKFLGASTFGIVSDKFGRRMSFTIGATLYLTGSILTCFSPWYWIFLIGRFCLGASASGLFYSAFTILSENISVQKRSLVSVAFSMSYPIGMLILALFANYLHQWRSLQLALTIPALLLILNCYFLKESPRWLVSKGREEEAYKIIFKTKEGIEFLPKDKPIEMVSDETLENNKKMSLWRKFKYSFKELAHLYGPSKYRRMALICHFTWCVTSLSYYVTALNADNLSANRVVYVASTGCVDIIGITLSIILLRVMGRKISIFLLFGLAGSCLLILLGIPKESITWIVTLAMIGRLGITAVYAIVTLHTAEIFPTEIRSSALGICSTCAHIGSIAAPYIVDFLGLLAWYIPTTICGVLVLLAGLLTLTHPETSTSNLQDKVKQEQ